MSSWTRCVLDLSEEYPVPGFSGTRQLRWPLRVCCSSCVGVLKACVLSVGGILLECRGSIVVGPRVLAALGPVDVFHSIEVNPCRQRQGTTTPTFIFEPHAPTVTSFNPTLHPSTHLSTPPTSP